MIAAARAEGGAYLATATAMSSKQEAWKYTNVRKLLDPFTSSPSSSSSSSSSAGVVAGVARAISHEDITAYVDVACVDACLVFVDGHYRADLSKIASIPADIDFASLQSGEVSEDTQRVLHAQNSLSYMVDVGVKPRDRYNAMPSPIYRPPLPPLLSSIS